MVGSIGTKSVVYTTAAIIRCADYLHRIEPSFSGRRPFLGRVVLGQFYSVRLTHVWAFFQHLTSCAKRK